MNNGFDLISFITVTLCIQCMVITLQTKIYPAIQGLTCHSKHGTFIHLWFKPDLDRRTVHRGSTRPGFEPNDLWIMNRTFHVLKMLIPTTELLGTAKVW